MAVRPALAMKLVKPDMVPHTDPRTTLGEVGCNTRPRPSRRCATKPIDNTPIRPRSMASEVKRKVSAPTAMPTSAAGIRMRRLRRSPLPRNVISPMMSMAISKGSMIAAPTEGEATSDRMGIERMPSEPPPSPDLEMPTISTAGIAAA
jgi:hypothetical protein